jgi:hypothetical protein
MKKNKLQQIILFSILLLYGCGKEDSENGGGSFNSYQKTILDSLNAIYGTPSEVYLDEPGSLDYNLSLLPIDRYTIKSLKIKGRINGNDVNCIHKLTNKKNLAILDLRETQIVDGGSYSYNLNTTSGYTSNSRPTKVNVITERMFDSCLGIKYIALPNNIFEIEDLAFRHCTDLLSLDIPNGVISIGSMVTEKCYSLNYLSLPNSLKSIKSIAFQAPLIVVRSYIETPFIIPDNTFNKKNSTILYVPKGSKQSYLNTEGWKDFKNIVEM